MVPEGGWPKFVDVGFSYISFTVKDVVAVLDHIKKGMSPLSVTVV